MQELLKNIQIRVSNNIYTKDPDSSDLGRKILRESVVMIHEGGFEAFTFKKLAQSLGTTESAIYRYFENKHKLLFYLMAWHWGWLEYELVFGTSNLAGPIEKLHKLISILCNPLKDAPEHDLFDLSLLNEVVSSESGKIVHAKIIGVHLEREIFSNYLRITERVTMMIEAVNPDYKHSKHLASVLIDIATHTNPATIFLPEGNDKTINSLAQREEFLWELAYKTLTK